MFIIHGDAAILKKYYNSSQTRQKYVIKLAPINLGKQRKSSAKLAGIQAEDEVYITCLKISKKKKKKLKVWHNSGREIL